MIFQSRLKPCSSQNAFTLAGLLAIVAPVSVSLLSMTKSIGRFFALAGSIESKASGSLPGISLMPDS